MIRLNPDILLYLYRFTGDDTIYIRQTCRYAHDVSAQYVYRDKYYHVTRDARQHRIAKITMYKPHELTLFNPKYVEELNLGHNLKQMDFALFDNLHTLYYNCNIHLDLRLFPNLRSVVTASYERLQSNLLGDAPHVQHLSTNAYSVNAVNYSVKFPNITTLTIIESGYWTNRYHSHKIPDSVHTLDVQNYSLYFELRCSDRCKIRHVTLQNDNILKNITDVIQYVECLQIKNLSDHVDLCEFQYLTSFTYGVFKGRRLKIKALPKCKITCNLL